MIALMNQGSDILSFPPHVSKGCAKTVSGKHCNAAGVNSLADGGKNPGTGAVHLQPGPVPAACPAGGSSWKGTRVPVAAACVDKLRPVAPQARSSLRCDRASPAQSHNSNIKRQTTAHSTVISICYTCLGRPLTSLTARTSSRQNRYRQMSGTAASASNGLRPVSGFWLS